MASSPLLLLCALLALPTAAHAQPPGGGGPSGRPQDRPAPERAPVRDWQEREVPRGTAVLRGVVVTADSGSPIRRAQVRVAGQGVGTRLATTDAQGRFEVKDLAAGRYALSASKGGFVALQYGQRRPSESGTPLDLADGQVLSKLVIGLPRGSVIGGRLTDEFGEPIANAMVSAMRYGYSGGARRLLPAASQNSRDTTDDQGQFRLFGLSPGEYVVSAGLRAGGDATEPSGESTGYAPTYYPGTPNVAEAQRVTVALGQEQTSIVFALIATRLVRVTGAVLSSQGTPLSNGMVTLTPAGARVGGGALAQSLSGRVDQAGQFRVSSVPPGRYVVQARSMAGRGGAAARAARGEDFGKQEITVGADDLDGVVIVTGPGARVAGQVVTETMTAPPLRAEAVAITARAADAESSLPQAAATVHPDWTFELSGLFDARLIRASLGQGWYLKAVTLSGQDITDTAMEFPAGQTVGGLQVVITDKATDVSGRVTDGRGAAVTDVSVVIFSANQARWTFQSRFIRAVRPDQEGRFQIRGLPPDERYLAAVVHELEDGQAGDPEFLASVRDDAVQVSLSEGETKILELKAPR